MTSTTDGVRIPVPLGIDAETGRLLDGLDAYTASELALNCRDQSVSKSSLAAKADSEEAHFGVLGDVDPGDLSQSGWAVMFSSSADQSIHEALQPLLDRRKDQTGGGNLFRIFEGPTGYQPGDSASAWLARRNVRMDVVDPVLGVPFYVMLVGPPDEIPFEFQYALDLYWAVGRLWFPTPDEFRKYAESILRYEDMPAPSTSRQMAVFAPRHDFDRATQMFSEDVASALANGSAGPIGLRQKFRLQTFIGDPATKDTLHRIWTGGIGGGTPALLFSGGHGMSFRPDDPRQEQSQGALVTQDWTGYGRIQPDHIFAASDLSPNARVHGLVHFLFACYGGGCPRLDNFNRQDAVPKQIASRPLLARLPQALMAHPQGGALAVLAHVDRAWSYSFRSGKTPQTQGFRDVLGRIMHGDRLGQATDQFNIRWAALSTELSEMLNQMQLGLQVDPRSLATQWVARDDARNYVLFGDPSVRLRVEDMPPAA